LPAPPSPEKEACALFFFGNQGESLATSLARKKSGISTSANAKSPLFFTTQGARLGYACA
ncbi:hypothetical protein CQA37_09755, partial [Helicobacter sp. MIT 99-10781]